MPSIDARELDRSTPMIEYFEEVKAILEKEHRRSPDDARNLIDRFFSLSVNPLERCLVMHRSPEDVAQDLASSLAS